MDKNPKNSEEQEETSESGRDKMNSLKAWFQENLRMLVSVAIVIAIAGGIYAYSKRTQPPAVQEEALETVEEGEGKISVIGGETAKEEKGEGVAEEKTSAEVSPQPQPAKEEAKPAEISRETETSFIEIAQKGDGATKLARRALANYLEKNSDPSLTAEHKVYIEDYLRRQVKDGKLKIGDSREFSKDMIAKAIEKSKNLTEKQLKNLEKYSQKIPELK